MICNAAKCIALIAGITVAAIHFDKPSILWLYLFVFAFGIEYKSDGKQEDA
jgi:hypothetical protein